MVSVTTEQRHFSVYISVYVSFIHRLSRKRLQLKMKRKILGVLLHIHFFVPVDYTFIKFVSKPKGAAPGKVVYTNQKTIYVAPKK